MENVGSIHNETDVLALSGENDKTTDTVKRKPRDHINVRSKSNLHESRYKRHSGGAIFLIEQTIKNSIHQSTYQNSNLFKSNSLSSLMNENFNCSTSKAKKYVDINAQSDIINQNSNEPLDIANKESIQVRGRDLSNSRKTQSKIDKTENFNKILAETSTTKENNNGSKEKDIDTEIVPPVDIITSSKRINNSYESLNNNIGCSRRLSSSQSSSSCNTTIVSEVTLGTIHFGDTNMGKRFNKEVDLTCLKVPIVGYEVMEERARFTVYKLRLMTNIPGESWLLLRRYTDFVRLHCRLKADYPDITLFLPKKKWFGDNFHPKFLQDRALGLQEFVNSVLSHHTLLESAPVKDFLCLNDPPVFSECLEDSRALFEAQEETIMTLRAEIAKRDSTIAELRNRLSREYSKSAQNHSILKNTKGTCEKCSKEINNTLKQFEDDVNVYTSTPTKQDKQCISNKS